MRFKILALLSFLFIGYFSLYAQDLNPYKYIIVPEKFDFQKTEDQYQVSSLTKFLFNKKGITALLDTQKQPDDLFNNPCMGLKVNVLDNSNMFSTKLAIQLSDCRNTIVYTTEEGRSKIKDLKKGHHDALRKAFQSIQSLEYSFDQSLVQTSGKELQNTEDRETEVSIDETSETVEGVEEIPNPVTKSEESVKVEPLKVIEKVEKDTTVEGDESMPLSTANVLYAQEIDNGYQLVDNTPKIIFIALKSPAEDLYYLKNNAGILYKEANNWFVEYYNDKQLVKKQLTIKF